MIYSYKFRPLTCSILIITALIYIASTANATTSVGPYVYVANDNTVSVIDMQSNNVTASIQVGYYPSGIAVNPAGTMAYVSICDVDRSVSVIDTATNMITSNISLGGVDCAQAIALSPDGTKLYVASYSSIPTGVNAPGNLYVIDTATNKVINTISLGFDLRAIAVTPDGTKIYVVGLAGNNLTVIDTATNTVTASLNLSKDIDSIAVSPDGTKIYLTNLDYIKDNRSSPLSILVLDAATNKVITTIPDGEWIVEGVGIAVSPDGTKLYATNYGDNSISVFDTSTNNLIDTIPVGVGPSGVTVSPDGTKLYVEYYDWPAVTNTISVIDTVTNTVTANITVGKGPDGIAFSPILMAPVVNFTANRTTGVAPLTMQFANNSSGRPSQWEWNFGDGTENNTTADPIHVYQNAGVYNVTLTAISRNGNSTLEKKEYIVVNTSSTPASSVSKLQIGGLSVSNNNSSTSGIIFYAKKASLPLATLLIGGLVGGAASLSWVSKIFEFIADGLKEVTNGKVNVEEITRRGIKPGDKKVWAFGLSKLELVVGLVSVVLLGLAFLLASQNPLSIIDILSFVLVAGVTMLLREFVHISIADHYNVKTEYRFWTLGTVLMFLTSIFLHNVFSQPSRILVDEGDDHEGHEKQDKDKDGYNQRKKGIIAISGSLVSLVLFIVFLAVYWLVPGNEVVRSAAEAGLLMNLVLCVYGLMPFKPMEGPEVLEWNKGVWATLFFLPLIAYFVLIVYVLG